MSRRASIIVLALGALIALALLVGAFDHELPPMDPDTPAEVTTIGVPR